MNYFPPADSSRKIPANQAISTRMWACCLSGGNELKKLLYSLRIFDERSLDSLCFWLPVSRFLGIGASPYYEIASSTQLNYTLNLFGLVTHN